MPKINKKTDKNGLFNIKNFFVKYICKSLRYDFLC